jgi:hypothetical protein
MSWGSLPPDAPSHPRYAAHTRQEGTLTMAQPCAGCGAELPPRTSRAKARKWCSEACRVRHTRKPYEPAAPRPVVCAVCASTFTARGRAVYCGDDCRAEGARRKLRERRAVRGHRS